MQNSHSQLCAGTYAFYWCEYEDTSILHENSCPNDEIVCNSTVRGIGASEKDLEQYCLDLIRVIRSSNLNKKLTNSLLKLANSTSSNKS